jgi:hypothetical protein
MLAAAERSERYVSGLSFEGFCNDEDTDELGDGPAVRPEGLAPQDLFDKDDADRSKANSELTARLCARLPETAGTGH